MARRFRHREEKPRFFSKKNAMSLFIILIMSLSVLGFVIVQRTTDSYKFVYNDFLFTQTGSGFYTKINDRQVWFRYSPEQIEDINISIDIDIVNALKSTRMVYATYDPDAKYPQDLALLSYELGQELPEYFELYVVRAMSKENDYNIAVITCRNATQTVPVIYFKDGNETKSLIKNNCILVETDSDIDFYYFKDRLLYAMFDIMPAKEGT